MPVSTPSYFPAQRGNGSIIGITAGLNSTAARVFLAGNSAGVNLDTPASDDCIAIGDDALSAGTITDVNSRGSVVIGSQAARALTAFTANAPGPVVIVGYNAFAVSVGVAASVRADTG